MGTAIRKIAFVSPHCLVDFTNGAATATRDGLKLLAGLGFQCLAFCGTRLDEAREGMIQEQLFRRKIDYEVRKVRIPGAEVGGRKSEAGGQTSPHPGPLPKREGDGFDARMIFLNEGSVAVTMFENGSTRGGWFGPREVQAFLAACDLFLRKNRPDVVVTYGGDPVSLAVQRLVKRQGIPLVFWLHNFAYTNLAAFAAAECVVVPSEFSRAYYRERLGLECHVLPNIVNWQAASVGDRRSGVGDRMSEVRERNSEKSSLPSTASFRLPAPCSSPPARYVTFINPQEIKGVYIFARIARELARRRPDIPILVTQGRSRADMLMRPELGLGPHLMRPLGKGPHLMRPLGKGPQAEASGSPRNIRLMPFTPDPGDFYPAVFAATKLLLMPSLWNESFGLVAAEAMLNGIPVLASSRGALPETIGEAGYLFDIPARYTSETRELPTAEEVEPWVETIIRLWDDAGEYDRASRAARGRAQRWHPDCLAPLYRDFFSRIARQPGPPLMPKNQTPSPSAPSTGANP